MCLPVMEQMGGGRVSWRHEEEGLLYSSCPATPCIAYWHGVLPKAMTAMTWQRLAMTSYTAHAVLVVCAFPARLPAPCAPARGPVKVSSICSDAPAGPRGTLRSPCQSAAGNMELADSPSPSPI